MGKKAVSSAPRELRLIDGVKKSKTVPSENLRLGKRKKVSKKNKLAWRKHTDVADIETFLDEKRQEERIEEATTTTIVQGTTKRGFFVDTEKDNDAVPVVRRAKKREKKPLRCEAALLPTVEPTVKPDKPATKKKVNRKVRAEIAMDDSSVSAEKKTGKSANVWAAEAPKTDEQSIFDQLTGKAPVKRPRSLSKKVSVIPAVEIAHPGASYNPSFDDHQAIIAEATEVEERKLRAVARTQKFFEGVPEMDHIERERVWMKEMSAGLDLDDDDKAGASGEEDENEESDVRGDEAAPAAPKLIRPEFRKTKQQRRKEAERRQQAAEAKIARLTQLREQEVFRIRSLKKNLAETEKKVQERRLKRTEKAAKELSTPRKLGPHRYRAPDVAVQLSDELPGALRKLKPEGSTLQDRFASLQRRNVLEPRRKVVPHRRYKQRNYTKNAYKDTTEAASTKNRGSKPSKTKK